jgi:hypothetical protein
VLRFPDTGCDPDADPFTDGSDRGGQGSIDIEKELSDPSFLESVKTLFASASFTDAVKKLLNKEK